MKSAEYQRGYDAGYRDAMEKVALNKPFSLHRKIGGPDSPFKPAGVPGSLYNRE